MGVDSMKTPPPKNFKRFVAFWFDEDDERRIADITWHGVIDSKIAKGDFLEMRDADVSYEPGKQS